MYILCLKIIASSRKNFGQTNVEVEMGKKERRSDGGLKNMTFSKFLHLYQTEDIYQVFDISQDMKSLLPFLTIVPLRLVSNFL